MKKRWCVLCQGDLPPEARVITTRSKHVFCEQCIIGCFQQLDPARCSQALAEMVASDPAVFEEAAQAIGLSPDATRAFDQGFHHGRVFKEVTCALCNALPAPDDVAIRSRGASAAFVCEMCVIGSFTSLRPAEARRGLEQIRQRAVAAGHEELRDTCLCGAGASRAVLDSMKSYVTTLERGNAAFSDLLKDRDADRKKAFDAGRAQMYRDLCDGGPVPEEGMEPNWAWLAIELGSDPCVRDPRARCYDLHEVVPASHVKEFVAEWRRMRGFSRQLAAAAKRHTAATTT